MRPAGRGNDGGSLDRYQGWFEAGKLVALARITDQDQRLSFAEQQATRA